MTGRDIPDVYILQMWRRSVGQGDDGDAVGVCKRARETAETGITGNIAREGEANMLPRVHAARQSLMESAMVCAAPKLSVNGVKA